MYKTILIDGDIIAHKACFACEERWYHLSIIDIDDRNSRTTVPEVFKYKRQAVDRQRILRLKGIDTKITKHKDCMPAFVAFKLVDTLITRLKYELPAEDYLICSGHPEGSGQFRYDIATQAPYKGNRCEEDRPIHIDDVKAYMHNKYNSIYAEEVEADDYLGILQSTSEGTVIASIDKDLLQIPGEHYNIDSQEHITSDDPGKLWLTARKSGKRDLRGYGFKWFCAQMLLGDAVDNIKKPKNGVGPVKIFDLLNEVDDPTKMWKIVDNIYNESIINIEENADLLWILRGPGNNWRNLV